MPFVPHTKEDIEQMLAALNMQTTDELFQEVPKAAICDLSKESALPNACNEMELTRLMADIRAKDRCHLNFVGAGCYEHFIPAVVWELATRGEFLTAYTPYQAEASQGTLQLLYEYQTMISRLLALDVANASLYDGASAVAEAVLMAIRSQRKIKKHRVLISKVMHPFYRQVLQTLVGGQGIEIIEAEFDPKAGHMAIDDLEQFTREPISVMVIAQPNFFGQIEAVDELTDWAHNLGAKVVACVNPMAMALLKPPGAWGEQGVDIACGEGQPLGVPMSSGGPFFGFLACRQSLIRQLPGRLVALTKDENGQSGFVLTLQAREQHIRRSKATSNICTNQGLLVTAASIYMSLLGAEGLREVAKACHLRTVKLKQSLMHLSGASVTFDGPMFHEVVWRTEKPVQEIMQQLAKKKIDIGFDLSPHYSSFDNNILSCATEVKTDQDIAEFTHELAEVL